MILIARVGPNVAKLTLWRTLDANRQLITAHCMDRDIQAAILSPASILCQIISFFLMTTIYLPLNGNPMWCAFMLMGISIPRKRQRMPLLAEDGFLIIPSSLSLML